MKIIITGSLGNISRPLVSQLVEKGHDVTVISHSAERKSEIETLGAQPAIGSLSDTDFLVATFTGADAVYAMIPPDYRSPDMFAYIADSGKIYADAFQKAGIKNVVALSSMGAHLPKGNGPLSALTEVEKTYNQLESVNVTYLRPGGFFTNYLAQLPLAQHLNILGDNTAPETRMLLTHPADIADVAAEALLNPTSGKNVRFIVSEEITNTDIAALIGNVIDKPGIPWVQFPAADYKGALVQNGFSESAAQSFVEMGDAFREGRAFEEVDAHQGGIIKGKRRFADFVQEVLAPAYTATV